MEPDDRAILGMNFGGLYVTEPMALELLAGAVPEYDVSIVDLRQETTHIRDYIGYLKPDLVGVTGFTAVHYEMEEIMAIAKASGAFTLAGGAHASFAWNKLENADAVIVGEGEGPFRDLVLTLDNGRRLGEVPNLVWHNNGEWQVNQAKFYDLWPLPRRTTNKYKYRIFEHEVCMVEATRGCPHRCNFCITPRLFGGRYRVRPPEELADYISMRDEPIIMFPDADFLVSPKYASSLLKEIKRRGIKKHYMIAARADEVAKHKELVLAWRQAGLVYIFIGFEGFDQSQLNSYYKDISIDSNYSAVSFLHRCSVLSVGTMLVDPEWDYEDFDNCLRYLKKLGSDITLMPIITPFPGTDIDVGVDAVDFRLYDNLHPITPTLLTYYEFQQQLNRVRKKVLFGWNLIRFAVKLLRHRLWNLRMLYVPLRIRHYIRSIESALKEGNK